MPTRIISGISVELTEHQAMEYDKKLSTPVKPTISKNTLKPKQRVVYPIYKTTTRNLNNELDALYIEKLHKIIEDKDKEIYRLRNEFTKLEASKIYNS